MPAELTAAELERAHETRLRQLTPRRLPNRPPHQQPRLILIGGQPAIGKTDLQSLLYAALNDPSLAVYDGDDNALVDPQYDALLAEHPLDGHDLAMTRVRHRPDLHFKCLDHLRAGRPQYDVLASQPLNHLDRSLEWVTGFKEHDYRVTVVSIAGHRAVSTLALAARFQHGIDTGGRARWFGVDAHDEMYDDIPRTAHVLEVETLIDDLYVVDRAGYVLYENHRDAAGALQHPPRMEQAIHEERNRPPTMAEVMEFRRTAEALVADRGPEAPRMPAEVWDAVLLALRRYDERPAPQEDLRRAEPAHQLAARIVADQGVVGAWRVASSGLVVPGTTTAGIDSFDGLRGRKARGPSLEL